MANHETPDPTAVWVDGDPLMEAIAAAVWEQCGRSDSGSCVEDDPRTIAAVAAAVSVPPPATRADDQAALRDRIAAAVYEHMHPGSHWSDTSMPEDWRPAYLDEADAVLAVLPEAADRAAILTEAADFVRGLLLTRTSITTAGLEAELRRLAAEAQQPDDEALRAKVDEATATLRRIRSTIRTLKDQGATGRAYYQAITDDLAGPRPDRCEAGDEQPSGGPVAGEQQNETPEAEREPDPDCERCDGSGLDPDAYFVEGDVWTHAPCSECLPEDDEADRG